VPPALKAGGAVRAFSSGVAADSALARQVAIAETDPLTGVRTPATILLDLTLPTPHDQLGGLAGTDLVRDAHA
jgi:hypothetical protein